MGSLVFCWFPRTKCIKYHEIASISQDRRNAGRGNRCKGIARYG